MHTDFSNTFFSKGCVAYNLGTGRGTSVLEMVTAFEKASGKVNFRPALNDTCVVNVFICYSLNI